MIYVRVVELYTKGKARPCKSMQNRSIRKGQPRKNASRHARGGACIVDAKEILASMQVKTA